MRRGLVCAVALLILVPAAGAATPAVTIQATPSAGPAPLLVTFVAVGDASTYHGDFGDGSAADGATVQHTYAAGRWTATLTARSSTARPRRRRRASPRTASRSPQPIRPGTDGRRSSAAP